MATKVNSLRTHGIEAVPVTVECEITEGIGIHLIGLADSAVKESLLRVITALEACGYHIPGKKIIINLTPADLRKSGSQFDLPIALAIIAESGQRAIPELGGKAIDLSELGSYVIAGELSLDGSVRDVPGWMQAALLAAQTGKDVILPLHCARLAARAMQGDIKVIGVENLAEAIQVITNRELRDEYDALDWFGEEPESSCEGVWDSIRGNFGAKRALEIAAAGGHSVLLVGPPSAHKEKFARALNEILPDPSRQEHLEINEIYSVVNRRFNYFERPFRAPHWSSSIKALLGGGNGENVLPGEVTLAHNGVLYLDEFVNFLNAVKEALRGPIEDGKVTISRLHGNIEFPAKFLHVLGTLPCPCGYYGEGDRCTCSPERRRAYLSKLSGSVYDHTSVQAWAHPEPLNEVPAGDSAEVVAARVARARDIQMRRQGRLNNELHDGAVCQVSFVGEAAFEMLNNITSSLGLSVSRAYAHIIRIARTIADLEGVEAITPQHIVEAAGYRFLDRASD